MQISIISVIASLFGFGAAWVVLYQNLFSIQSKIEV